MEIDFERLRHDLLDYFGSATPFFTIAMADVIRIEKANDIELLNIINETDLDINNYIYSKTK